MNVKHVAFVLLFATAVPAAAAADDFRYTPGKTADAELRYVNGVAVFTAAGSPGEIGTSYGKLILAQNRDLIASLPQFLKRMGLAKYLAFIEKAGGELIGHADGHHVAELRAAAKAGGMTYRDLVIVNAMADLHKLGGCSTVVVEAARSRTGAPLFGRNFDWPPYKNMHRRTAVLIYKADGKNKVAAVSLPGVLGVISGMNDKGLCLTTNAINKSGDKSKPLDPAGVPLAYLYRKILEECGTVDEAEKLLRAAKRSTYAAVTVCDRAGGAVFEITPAGVVRRGPVEGVSVCTNHFIGKGTAVDFDCWRLKKLKPLQDPKGASRKLGVAAVKKQLAGVGQWIATLQSMVFEPAAMRLHLALAKDGQPATGQPYRVLDMAKLFAD